MTVAPTTASLMNALFPEDAPAPTYAILDGARDELIHDETAVSGNPFMLLYKGRLGPELEASAPRLVDLRHGDAFGEWLLERGWGNSWGIFLRSAAPMKDLRKHFRTFLKVKAEGGGQMYFRYYDPRVFRLYLPTCTVDELAYVFGPVDEYLIEAEDPGTLLRFRRDEGGGLVQSQVRIADAAPAPEPESSKPEPVDEGPLPTPDELLAQLRSMRDRLSRAEQGVDKAASQSTADTGYAYLRRLKARLAETDDPGYDPIRKQVDRAVKRLEFRQKVDTRVLRAGVKALLVSLKAY